MAKQIDSQTGEAVSQPGAGGTRLRSWEPWPPWGPWGPGPYNPFPPEFLALAAGALHGKALRDALRQIEETGKDHRRFMRIGLDRLASSCQIPPHEIGHLYEIVDLVVEFQQRPANTSAVADRVRQIHERLVDLSATPVALAIAGVAVDSTASNRNVAAADVEGAIGGAGVGAQFGIWGAVIGGLIGGAAASIAEAFG